MKVYHQTGHNFIWNINSFQQDGAGDGLILSPVNIKRSKVISMGADVKRNSFFDPQWYLPKDKKGQLATYEFFPANIKDDFTTDDFTNHGDQLAEQCVDFQINNDFESILVPARYFDILPNGYHVQTTEHIIEPFTKCCESLGTNRNITLTVIVKKSQLLNEVTKNDLLNWITGIQKISGVYLIFEHDYTSKQIIDTNYLYNALTFIHALKSNALKVHVGYNNIEGMIYSIANPDSISMGSYENLRNFSIDRFEADKGSIKSPPTPRVYSKKLLQFIAYGNIGALQRLYNQWESLFEDTPYFALMLDPNYSWHFTKPEPYKHFFMAFFSQVRELPDTMENRMNHIKQIIETAIHTYDDIKQAGVLLDQDSDGSHLTYWLTVINMFEAYLEEN